MIFSISIISVYTPLEVVVSRDAAGTDGGQRICQADPPASDPGTIFDDCAFICMTTGSSA
jgi:hypothetical protein